jgi:hypothetical protein
LCFCQLVVGYPGNDSVHWRSRKSVGDLVILSFAMLNIHEELCESAEVALLTCCPGVRAFLPGFCECAVIRE